MQNPLSKPLRTQLENTIKAARDVAERAALAALNHLGVGDTKWPEHLVDDAQKSLRRRLREHGRSLGDGKHKDDSQDLTHLKREVAYEHWHRMLFARFLAENNLLLWEPGAPVTLAECEELAQDPSTNFGTKSGWELAGKLAARMLPRVFKTNSPVFELRLSPNEQRDLENLLKNLPKETFRASDSLGWVYQFWQASRKDEVNVSEVKIGADELPAVTQLFTEPYMVEFLLHNSLGVWWHTRHPGKPCPVEFSYLRMLDDGTPAAGHFEGWPDTLASFKLLDPCCGSGHFLVAAFLLLVPMRMAAEGLSAKAAVDAVLRDNLHGLEIDPRCVEIAVFALALTAWRYPDESGHPLGVRSEMPAPIVACCGLKVAARAQDWEALVPESAANAQLLRQELRLLHASFTQAPLLGSLLDPAKSLKHDLATSNFDTLKSLLDQALTVSPAPTLSGENDQRWENALAAQGLLESAQLLELRYDLVATNVPYLTRGKQSDALKEYCGQYFSTAKNDLATIFVERCYELCTSCGVFCVVSPQNWWFLKSYTQFRNWLLTNTTLKIAATLGEEAWEYFGDRGPLATLLIAVRSYPPSESFFTGFDAFKIKTLDEKKEALRTGQVVNLTQASQLSNPDVRLVLEKGGDGELLSKFAFSSIGLSTSDTPLFIQYFWEHVGRNPNWEFHQSATEETNEWSGCEHVVLYEQGTGKMRALAAAQDIDRGRDRQGINAWGRHGVAVGLMRNLPASLYIGNKFDNNIGVLVPFNEQHSAAIWCFCSSKEYYNAIRRVDKKLNVTNGTLVKVPFDLVHWQQVATEQYPNGLPKPYSDDPNQWIFHGHPRSATDPLQVAVARILGCTWPAESNDKMALSDEARTWVARCQSLATHSDDDGIACLPAVRGEKPAHERLLELLIDAWESVEPGSWKPAILDRLLAEVGCAGKGLDVWLREEFFAQHAKRFQHRPFIWHICDGLKDGFSALVNYHKLDNKNLERLIHTYLGDWIRNQEQGVSKGIDGAQTRLAAARNLKTRLEAILEGEAPYDIFVRWKPLAEQSIGWNPDLNDGVRLNIRPFMQAEVLRHNKKPKLNITWDKDRGKDVDSAPWFAMFKGERINDHHLTLEEKRRSRG